MLHRRHRKQKQERSSVEESDPPGQTDSHSDNESQHLAASSIG